MTIQRVGDLEIEQDLRFQRREWRVQRIGWLLMALLICAALLGVFGGGGLLTGASDSAAGGAAKISYQRFARLSAPASLKVRFPESAVQNGMLQVAVERDYIEGVQIEHITPEPESVEVTADAIVYTFAVGDPSGAGQVAFHYTTESIGLVSGWVELADTERLTLRQFVYP